MTDRRVLLAAGLSAALFAAACNNDDLFSPAVPPYTGGAMFQRVVAMGNSITAGFQSGGINDSTQKQSYALLAANAMGSVYTYPSLAMPGCPAPFTNIFTGARVLGVSGTACAFRGPLIPSFLTNVAVVGAEVLDAYKNGPGPGTNSTALTQLMLGGRTQVQAMQAAQPTFVTVWLGNNDLLGAAEVGDTTLATDTATFHAEYAKVLDSIKATGAGALLIAVGLGHLSNNVVVPFFSRGSTWYGLWLSGAFLPAPFTVALNCAPPRGDTVLVSFPYGFGLLGAAQLGMPTTLDCTAPPGSSCTNPATDMITLTIAGSGRMPTLNGWLIVNGSISWSGSATVNGLVYAQNDISITGNATVNGAIVSKNVVDAASTTVDSTAGGSLTVTYNCYDAKTGNGTIPVGWYIKQGSYREMSD